MRHDDCNALDDLHAQLAEQPTHDEELLVYRIFDGLTDAFYPVIDGARGTRSTRSRPTCSPARGASC